MCHLAFIFSFFKFFKKILVFSFLNSFVSFVSLFCLFSSIFIVFICTQIIIQTSHFIRCTPYVRVFQDNKSKIVKIKVFLTFLLVDRRIRIHNIACYVRYTRVLTRVCIGERRERGSPFYHKSSPLCNYYSTGGRDDRKNTICLCRYPDDSKTALYCATEKEGAAAIRTKTFGQLKASVAKFAAGTVPQGADPRPPFLYAKEGR